ncbi:MAG: type III-B CRISPR module RAMP protein Cmr1, partial [Candidatus Bathyarchaeia archaeon]
MKVMKPWLELQKDILKELTIAEIKLSNITPVRIGGYNARPYSDALGLVEKVRTQAIKGIWRWWARAILAGALLSTQGTLPSTISEMNDEVSNLLGSTKESSHFFVQVEEMDYSFIALNKLQFIPRIKLLSMSSEQNKEERYYHPLRFKLTLGTRRRLTEPDKNTAMFALSSLLISLIFSGIGSITTRGFGKFRISLNSKNQLLINEINNLDKLLKELYSQNKEDDVTKKLEEIILTSLNYAINYKSPGSTVRKNVEINELPPFPALL